MPSLEDAALADRMYVNFQKVVHRAFTEDNYKPQKGDLHAADICSRARAKRFFSGGLMFAGSLFLCTYIVNWPKRMFLKALMCFPAAYVGGRCSMLHADQECILAVLNQNTPLAREMEDFLRNTHPGYSALNDMKDFSRIQDRQPSISWLRINDPVRLKDFQFSEDELEQKQQTLQEEQQQQQQFGPFFRKPFGGIKEAGILQDIEEAREHRQQISASIFDFFSSDEEEESSS